MYEKRGVLHLKNFYAFILENGARQRHLLFSSHHGAFFAAKPQKTGLSASIQVAWATSNPKGCGQPLARPGAAAKLR
jgi:hypothetical protein